jgi:drug/metabolite transporter (DMT)-like permease
MLANAIDPIMLASIRFIVSGVIMLPFCKINLLKLSKKEIFGFVFVGVVGIAGCFIPYHIGVPQMSASCAALIFCLNPIFAVITAGILLKEKFSPKIAVGLFLGIFGVYISTHGFSLPQFSQASASVLLLISAITFGIYTASSKWLVAKYSAVSVAAVVFTIGGFVMLAFVRNWQLPKDTYSISIIVYLILATTAIGYLCFFYALKYVSVAAGSSIFFLKPVLAAVFSFLILQETLTITYFMGMAISLLSLFVILYAKGGKNE